VVDKIKSVKTGTPKPGMENCPVDAVVIQSIRRAD
jgi:hypothetical protein